MQRYLTIAALFALVGTSAQAGGGIFDPGAGGHGDMENTAWSECTIQYACGDGATGTAPTGTSVSSGTTFTPAANTCAKDGYVFSHYLATVDDYTVAQDGVAKPGVTYTIPFNGSNTCANNITITMTPQWVAASGTPVVSAKSYTDAELATRQANFTASATDKLILFSGSTDGAVGERAVVTSLGTPNSTTGLYSGTDLSSTEVPTNGAVNTGVNRKQATVTGTANYVAMYDENAHMTGGSKGIYNASSLTDLDTLVEAGTLNSAIVDAVNSELVAVDTDPAGRLWRVNSALSLLGPASGGGSGSGGGTSAAAKALVMLFNEMGYDGYLTKEGGNNPSSAICPDEVYNQMSIGDGCQRVSGYDETTEEYVYGVFVARGACSTVISNDMGDIPENQSQIDSDYASGLAGGNCYCKLTKVYSDYMGYDLVSPWVYSGSDSGGCNHWNCTDYCTSYSYGVELRNAVQ